MTINEIDEEMLANLKQTNPEADGEIAVQEKNLQLKEKEKRREKAVWDSKDLKASQMV